MTSNTLNVMRKIAPLLALAVALALGSQAHAADLQTGQAKFLKGDYKAAQAELAKVGGKDREAAQLALARVELRVGKYAAAEKRARKLIKSRTKGVGEDATVLVAEAQRAVGNSPAAIKPLEKVFAKNPKHLRARYVLGLVYRDVGQNKKANALFDQFIKDWNTNKIDQKNASQSFYVAASARRLGLFQDANDTFREVVKLNSKLLDANIEWGQLFMDKYSAGYASQSFDEVLKIDPNHPDAHAGMAKVKLVQSYDLAAAGRHIKAALKANPKHVQALLIRSGLEIDQNQWAAAKATFQQVFAINPNSLPGHAGLATVYWLRELRAKYEATKKKAFAINPKYAEFFHIVARSAVREHRYDLAIKLELEAVKIEPKYYEAMQAVGTGYLRLGKEKLGLRWLKRAWKGDEYNVRTFNLMNLFEEEIPKNYSFTRTKYFKFRYHNEEKDILRRSVEPMLTRAFESMVKRYKFTPKLPIVIELYRESQHYSVRTVGLPNLGALGVCFGQVITAMSPSSGNINWAMVLWHELAHVFAIQMSKSKVPRWYTEGLSEYETIIARPEWRRENDSDIAAAMAAGKLPPVAELNYGFMKPSMRQVVVAYHLSSVTIEYIATTYGFNKIVEGLKLFGKNMETPEVIHKITGLTAKQFDVKFRKFLAKRLKPYKGQFRIPTEGYKNVTALEIAVAAKPKDAKARADLALGYFFDGNAKKAKANADKALAMEPTNKIALYINAEIAFRMRNTTGAKKLYLQLIDMGADNYDIRGRLAAIAKVKGDLKAAEKQLCAAKKLDPERSYPYLELSRIYKRSKRPAKALKELETYVMIEQMQPRPLSTLVDEYKAKGNWAKVRTYGELLLNIRLWSADLYLTMGRAYVETNKPDKALFSYKSALITKPRLRRPALAYIGMAKAWKKKKNRRKAKAMIKKALKFEPANAEALKLQKKL